MLKQATPLGHLARICGDTDQREATLVSSIESTLGVIFSMFRKELNAGDGERYSCSLHECLSTNAIFIEPHSLEFLIHQA